MGISFVKRISMRSAFSAAAAVSSGVLLWLAFAPAENPEAAWFALVPLLLVARHARVHDALRWGGLSGLTFWGLSLSWLWKLSDNGGPIALVILGYLALAAYCAVYTAVFALLVARLWQPPASDGSQAAARSTAGVLGRMAVEPLLWVGLEFIRSTLLSGFAWNGVGVSQFRNLALIQVAALGGVYAVSALILLVNSALASVAVRLWRVLRRQPGRRRNVDLILALLIVMAFWVWGMRRLGDGRGGATIITVAAVQPNTPSIFEVTDDMRDAIHQGLRKQSLLASAYRPDLIVWPETALLGWLPDEPETRSFVTDTAREIRTPLLAGTIEIETVGIGKRGPEYRYYNSSWLFDTNGFAVGRYRKQHLVPFGEYFPLDKQIPWLERFSPVGFSCSAGGETSLLTVSRRAETNRVMTEAGANIPFSPLICFEDTVAVLARRAVQRGACFLVNQTNDAWFDGSSEPLQHMAQAVFRCVENGVPMLRCANSGVTCVIEASGQVRVLELDGRQTGFAGFLIGRLRPAHPHASPTLYTRYGDRLFAQPCAVLVVLMGGMMVWRRRRRRRTQP